MLTESDWVLNIGLSSLLCKYSYMQISTTYKCAQDFDNFDVIFWTWQWCHKDIVLNIDHYHFLYLNFLVLCSSSQPSIASLNHKSQRKYIVALRMSKFPKMIDFRWETTPLWNIQYLSSSSTQGAVGGGKSTLPTPSSLLLPHDLAHYNINGSLLI